MQKKLSNEQEQIASELNKQKKCPQKALAQLADVSQPTISRAINNVEHQNIVDENTRLKNEIRNLTMECIGLSHLNKGEIFYHLDGNERKRLEDCGYFSMI